MQREARAGALLIVGSLADIAALALHPTAHDLLGSGATHQARLAVLVHAAALAAVPVLFLGLAGLSRRLGWTDLTRAALVAYGFGAVAVSCAAVASGFVATPVSERILTADAATRDLYHALLTYTGLWNRGFAEVYLVASSAAFLLWGTAILRSRRLGRAAGVAGLVVGAAVLALFLAGHLRLDVHGFGMVTFAQSGWLIWLGVGLLRDPGRPPAAGPAADAAGG